MQDDIYPASTEFRFGVEPVNKQKDLQAEYETTLSQLPLLKEELKRLDERIKATDSVAEALAIAKTYEISVENALVVLRVINPILSVEKSIIEGKVKALSKRQR